MYSEALHWKVGPRSSTMHWLMISYGLRQAPHQLREPIKASRCTWKRSLSVWVTACSRGPSLWWRTFSWTETLHAFSESGPLCLLLCEVRQTERQEDKHCSASARRDLRLILAL